MKQTEFESATGEALAHLHYLEKRAELHAELKGGRRYFSRT